MKRSIFMLGAAALLMASCASNKVATGNSACISYSKTARGAESQYLNVPVDKDGYLVIFDGKTLNGWRGYGKDHIPAKWSVEDGCIRYTRSNAEGGDIIFAHNFKNFILEMEWKISQGGNSGIFYLGQETVAADNNGNIRMEPIYISCPECQVLDNENHPDAKLGVDGNRKSSSLYDMIPAKPQNAKPFGEWNKVKITVNNGTVTHNQNGVDVLSYQLWTPEWTKMLQASKFSEKAWPHAFELLNNCGGVNRAGMIGVQDHGDDVWYRNIRVKVLP